MNYLGRMARSITSRLQKREHSPLGDYTPHITFTSPGKIVTLAQISAHFEAELRASIAGLNLYNWAWTTDRRYISVDWGSNRVARNEAWEGLTWFCSLTTTISSYQCPPPPRMQWSEQFKSKDVVYMWKEIKSWFRRGGGGLQFLTTKAFKIHRHFWDWGEQPLRDQMQNFALWFINFTKI